MTQMREIANARVSPSRWARGSKYRTQEAFNEGSRAGVRFSSQGMSEMKGHFTGRQPHANVSLT